MRFIKQMFQHAPEEGIYGDCFRTAVACVVECDPADLPHEHRAMSGDDQGAAIDAWLQARGVIRIGIPFVAEDVAEALRTCAAWSKGLPYLFVGRSRNDANHVVIGLGDAIAHDPSQNDSGIVGPTDLGFYFCEWLVRSAEGIARPGPASGLTRRQQEALDFIRTYCAMHPEAPSFSEIGKALGLSSKNSVSKLVYRLKDRGCIAMLPYRARSIVLTTPLGSAGQNWRPSHAGEKQ